MFKLSTETSAHSGQNLRKTPKILHTFKYRFHTNSNKVEDTKTIRDLIPSPIYADTCYQQQLISSNTFGWGLQLAM